MRLRTKALAAALGVAVFASAPAPAAGGHGFQLVADDDEENQWNWGDEPGSGSNPGGSNPGGSTGGSGGGGGGGDGGDGGGAPSKYTLQKVMIVGHREVLPDPPPVPQEIQLPVAGIGGEGGGSGEASTLELGRGAKEEKRESDCFQNSRTTETTVSDTFAYTVNYKTSTTLSASAAELLKIEFNAEVNHTYSKTRQITLTLGVGERFGIFVEYQTVAYRIVTWNGGNWQAEYVNVMQPTGLVRVGPC